MKHPSVLVAMLLVTATACVRVPGQDVPDVRTPLAVVNEMLRLADVTASDTVYDLGSGDGRILIAAARDRGARGVGLEIDPVLVAQSTERARRLGLADRLSFRQQDLFEADLTPATVVTLYLSPDLNRRLPTSTWGTGRRPGRSRCRATKGVIPCTCGWCRRGRPLAPGPSSLPSPQRVEGREEERLFRYR